MSNFRNIRFEALTPGTTVIYPAAELRYVCIQCDGEHTVEDEFIGEQAFVEGCAEVTLECEDCGNYEDIDLQLYYTIGVKDGMSFTVGETVSPIDPPRNPREDRNDHLKIEVKALQKVVDLQAEQLHKAKLADGTISLPPTSQLIDNLAIDLLTHSGRSVEEINEAFDSPLWKGIRRRWRGLAEAHLRGSTTDLERHEPAVVDPWICVFCEKRHHPTHYTCKEMAAAKAALKD